MKTTKTSVSKRAKPIKTARKATAAKHTRPLHKRLLLHPFSVMVVLCVGVILAGSTYQSLAVGYDVTATVEAPPAGGPAVIAAPLHLQHVTTQQVVVAGTCPAATYVKLYRASVFSGTSSCSAQTFQVQTSLTPGANELQAKVYNVTNLEGPVSSPVTVYYDDTTATPATPASVPTTMWVTNLDNSTYERGGVQLTSTRPTISGFAVPYADIVVTFHSEVSVCKTRADSVGWWSCTLDHDLPPGIHHVDVTASNDQGWSAVLPTFTINVSARLANLLKPQTGTPLLIASEYKFQTHYAGQPFTWNLAVTGGKAPYVLNVEWGDDSRSAFNRVNGDAFSLTHAYPAAKTYTVLVKVGDSHGATAMLQLNAVVKGQPLGAASLTGGGPLTSLFSSVQRYLWIVWPVYIAVVLMVISFWLGEQDVYVHLRGRRQAHAGRRR